MVELNLRGLKESEFNEAAVLKPLAAPTALRMDATPLLIGPQGILSSLTSHLELTLTLSEPLSGLGSLLSLDHAVG